MFVVLIFFCFALGLKFEEIDGILIYTYETKKGMDEREKQWDEREESGSGCKERERERERERGLRKK